MRRMDRSAQRCTSVRGASKCDRGASGDVRGVLRVRKKERGPRFFTIKIAIAGGSSEARILS